jgi:hypothetical protein
MGITRSQIESAAPDQAALKAASGLLKPAKWPLRGRDAAGGLLWGECQGSGANPYRVAADLSDLGAKCTCPSRKFPCKHALALMWFYADDPAPFQTGEAPDWVAEWLGRRRKGSASPTPASTATKARGGDISAALADELETEADPKAEARRAAATVKRAEDTRTAILAATRDLDGWISDQLRTGLAGLIADLPGRCRRIAARLVDGKAQALASRIDEMPARILRLKASEQPDAVVGELSKLVLLVRAWRASPDDPGIAREVATAESRDAVLENPATLRIEGEWEVLGDRIASRRDGLVSHASWLLLREGGAPGAPRFALLQDFYPASAGRRTSAFSSGDRFHGQIAYYPGMAPRRGVIATRRATAAPVDAAPALTAEDPLSVWRDQLAAVPWSLDAPVLLPPGRLARDSAGKAWWLADSDSRALPLDSEPAAHLFGMHFEAMAGIWTGAHLDLLAAWSDWGRITFDD